MITIRDALMIARAKLRMRRVRLTISILVASLMFAGLMFVGFVIAGVTQGITKFSSEGFGSRYLVAALPLVDTSRYNSPDSIKELTQIQENYVKQKQAAAKRLGVNYDEKADNLPVICYADPCTETNKGINLSSPLAKDYALSKLKQTKLPLDGLNEAIRGYDTVGVYQSVSGGFNIAYTSPYFSSPSTAGGMVGVSQIKDGKEVDVTNSNAGAPKGISTVTNLGWKSHDKKLLEPFLLTGQNLAVGEKGDIPVIVPVSVAQEILGLDNLSPTATSKQKLDRIVELRSKVAGVQFELCVRNPSENDRYMQAKSQAEEFEKNKDNRAFVAPSLIYELPKTACGATTVKSDTRSQEEKQLTLNQEQFDKEYGVYEAPRLEIVKLRIVGVTPDIDDGMGGFSLVSLLAGVVQSSLGSGWFTAEDSVTPGSLIATMVPPVTSVSELDRTFFVEFATSAEAKRFVDEQNCTISIDFLIVTGPGTTTDPVTERNAKCIGLGKYFDMQPYGSSSVAIDNFKAQFWKGTRYVVLAVLIMASLVLMGVVGKIIADSRRETAVFRALGANRLVIAQIYITFTLLLSLIMMLVSTIFGYLFALWINGRYSEKASTDAIVMFNSLDITKKFSFFGVEPSYVAGIFGLIALSAVLSALVPLLSNVRRNPIKDMRDEG